MVAIIVKKDSIDPALIGEQGSAFDLESCWAKE